MPSKATLLSYAFFVALVLCLLAQQAALKSFELSTPSRAEDKLPPDLAIPKLRIPNACFVSSMDLKGAYVAYCTAHKYRHWAKLLLTEQLNPKNRNVRRSHVVCVFEYFGRFYVYDINRGVYALANKDIRRASASAVAAMLKPMENYQLGESLWVEEP